MTTTARRPDPPRLSTAAAGVILASALVAGCGGDATPRASTAEPDPGAAAPATEPGRAPAFELPALDGGTVALDDSSGEVRLIDFWATWCAPCREEIPMLNALHERYGEQGLEIIAISDEDPALVREFVERHAVRYTNLIDRGGDVTARYAVPGLPTAFLVDRDGRVVERFFGPKPESVLEQRIGALLGEPAA